MNVLGFIAVIMISVVTTMHSNKVSTEEVIVKTESVVVDNKTSYQIINKNYIDKSEKEHIVINYPEISTLSDVKKQALINEIIKKEAMRVITDFPVSTGGRELELNYTVTYQDDQFLSIKYLGYAYVEGAVYPVAPIYTTTIDLKNAKSLTLNDIIQIDEEFIAQLKNGKYVKWTEDIDLKEAGALENELAIRITKDLIDELKGKEIAYYLTKDALVVSIETSHLFGHHIELAIDYKKLANKVKLKEIME